LVSPKMSNTPGSSLRHWTISKTSTCSPSLT
jgi:hypothetical protein